MTAEKTLSQTPSNDNTIPAFSELSPDMQELFKESLQRSGYEVESLGLEPPAKKQDA